MNAPTSKIEISASMYPNFMTKFLLESTSKCLSNDMFIIFFGYVVVNNLIMKDCVLDMKLHRNWIEFHENCIFHGFLMNLNALTSKIQISASMSPNFVIRIFSGSTRDGLSNDIIIIFFGCVF